MKRKVEAGFEIFSEETKTERGAGVDEETWLWALARRPP